MHDSKRAAIVKKIIKLANNAKDPRVHESGERRSLNVFTANVAFRLTDDCADLFDDVLKDLLNVNKWGVKFSEKYIDTKLKEIIGNIIRDGNSQRALEYFIHLDEEYESYSEEHILYVPLFGIEMSEKPIKLGKVTLMKMDDKNIKKLKSRLKLAISKTLNTDDEKRLYFKQEEKNFDTSLKNKTCAVISIVAEPDRALEIAEREIQRTIDLLRYAIPAIYSPGKRVFIGLQGEYSWQTRYVPIFSASGGGLHIKDLVVGPLFSLELSSKNIEIMRKIGIFKLANLLEKDELTDFEGTLLLAFEWFSRSQTQSDPKNKLLNLMTVLETCLNPGSPYPIQTTIAEGAAILLEHDIKRRKILVDKIKGLYGLRSTTSHGSKKEILDKHVQELIYISGSILMILLKRKDYFVSKQELLDWIEFRKLGGLPNKWKKYKNPVIQEIKALK